MKAQATRTSARHEQAVEITGCILCFSLGIALIIFLHVFPWASLL